MNAEKLSDVGAIVRILRKQRGLSLRALAEMCNISPDTVSLVERGLSSPCVALYCSSSVKANRGPKWLPCLLR
jgi:transcriptional regulator with XRE-family HTH domain